MKGKTGIYVGESARSIYERASEHKRDAEDNSEDSHMVKHWRSDVSPTQNCQLTQTLISRLLVATGMLCLGRWQRQRQRQIS